ncbi:8830_t:CDS:2 [Gigaspora margarita]|uniref:8830_t:CDS:1 n=1 Tax=Gigaspora margarita TaxID=4874 RepID=A0ABN7ULR4_GIGMA|nr:8830_t:CDS:2 [Gigaspora margarita]
MDAVQHYVKTTHFMLALIDLRIRGKSLRLNDLDNFIILYLENVYEFEIAAILQTRLIKAKKLKPNLLNYTKDLWNNSKIYR